MHTADVDYDLDTRSKLIISSFSNALLMCLLGSGLDADGRSEGRLRCNTVKIGVVLEVNIVKG